jgi:hypothetical protein
MKFSRNIPNLSPQLLLRCAHQRGGTWACCLCASRRWVSCRGSRTGCWSRFRTRRCATPTCARLRPPLAAVYAPEAGRGCCATRAVVGVEKRDQASLGRVCPKWARTAGVAAVGAQAVWSSAGSMVVQAVSSTVG